MQKQIQPKHAHFHFLLLLTQDLTWCSGPSEMLHYFLMPTLNCEPLELEKSLFHKSSLCAQTGLTCVAYSPDNLYWKKDCKFWPLFTRQKCGTMKDHDWTCWGQSQQGLFLGTLNLEREKVNSSAWVTHLVAHQEEVLSQQKVFQHIFHHQHVLQRDYGRQLCQKAQKISFISLTWHSMNFISFIMNTVLF